MAWKKRKFPTTTTAQRKSMFPYKSMLEKRLGDLMPKCWYERVKVKYIIPHTYNPDFGFDDKEWLLIEAKGRFINGSAEAKKYVEVAKQHKEYEIVFIFERSLTKAYASCKKRRDGSVLTLGEWAAKNNFMFFDEKKIPRWFIEGDFDRDKIIREKTKVKQEWLGK